MSPFLLLAQILTLTGPLADWANDIERLTHSKILVMRLNPAELPIAEPHRSVAARHFADPAFQQMFAGAQALSLNPDGPAGPYQYVFVNPRLAPDDPPSLQGLLGHELGHLWIRAGGYPTPRYAPGEAGCLSVTTGDALQHVLMRSEMDRRGIEWRKGFIRQLEPALEKMKEPPDSDASPTPLCQLLAQVSLYLDASLAITAQDWSSRGEFLNLMEARFPAAARQGKILSAELAGVDLADKAMHRRELQSVFSRLKEFAVSQSK